MVDAIEREKQRRWGSVLEGEAERAKERSTHRWTCVEGCRERDVETVKALGVVWVVWGWPRCGCVVRTEYLSSHCLPQIVPYVEMANEENASTAGHRREVKNGDNYYTTLPASSSHPIDFEIKECKEELDSGWIGDNLLEFVS